MRVKEIELRLAQISVEMKAEGADLNALNKETDELIAERKKIQAEERAKVLNEIANGTKGQVVADVNELIGGASAEQRTFGVESAEYRSAYLKDLLGVDLSKEERAAFVATTANTTAPLPAQMIDQIWDLVTGQHSILGDITVYKTGVAIEIVKHTEVTQGKAVKKGENTANDDEKNTFVKVTLSGNDFTKHIDVSYAMLKMSIDAFEQYLVNEIAASLGEALADETVTQIGSDMNAANKFAGETKNTVTYAEMAKLIGMLKRVNGVVLYASRSTIYNHLVGMVDTTGRPIFQPNAQNGAEGSLIGATIKVEDSVADGKILVGDPKKVVGNMVQDILLENDKDIKKHVVTFSGYARFECALIDDKAFAEYTVKTTD